MKSNSILYRINIATEKNIEEHLNKCSDLFIPKLSSYVNIHQYSKKIREYAITFEAWNNHDNLVGLIACYLNDDITLNGHITSVSVDREFSKRGIANKLIKNTINYALKENFKTISLEVSHQNKIAINIYKKYNFYIYKKKYDIYKMLKYLNINNKNQIK